MAYLLCAGVLFYLAAVLFFLSCIAANKKPSPDRLPARDIRFLAGTCFLIGMCLLIMGR